MALAYRAASFVSAGNASGGDLTLTKPTGTVDGDIVVIGVYFEPDTTTITVSPGTWESVAIANTGTFKIQYFLKVAASEPASYTIANSTSGNQWRAAVGAAYSGGTGSGTRIDVSGTAQADGVVVSTNQTAPSVTTTGADRMLIFGYGNFNGNNPPGLTGAASNNRGALGSVTIGDALRASSGATGTTAPTGLGTEDYAALHVAIISDLGASTFTLSGGGTVPVPSGSGTGLTFTAPVYSLSGSGTLSAPTGSGTGLAVTNPVYTLSGGATVDAPTGSGTGLTFTNTNTYTLSGSGTVDAPTGSGTGLTFVAPVYSLSGSGTLDAPTGSGTGLAVTNPSYTLSGGGTVTVPSGSGAGLTFTNTNTYTLSGTGTVDAPTGSGAGLTYRTLGVLSGSGTIDAPTGTGTGLTYRSLGTLSGGATVDAPSGGGTGLTATAPTFTLSGGATVNVPVGSGAGLLFSEFGFDPISNPSGAWSGGGRAGAWSGGRKGTWG